MSYKIISDSSCDVWKLGDADFATAPLTISTDERTYVDDENMDVHDMLQYLAQYKNRSYTACPGVEAWLKAFGDSEELYVVTLTSGLSGTYNSALTAKDQYLELHPNAKVFVHDTLSTCGEQLLILEKIYELKENGCSFEEVCEQVKAYNKKTRLFFAFQSLHNFAQNGRVPKILAQALGVLGITIIGTASEAGTVEPISKCRGKKKVLKNLMEQLATAGYKGGKVNICHIENQELAEDFLKVLKEAYPDVEAKVYLSRGLVAYYGEAGGVLVACECEKFYK